MKIVPYDPKYKQDFIELNLAWISAMFKIEQEDIRELDNIETYLEAGRQVFFAVDSADNVMACCLIGPEKMEIGKS